MDHVSVCNGRHMRGNPLAKVIIEESYYLTDILARKGTSRELRDRWLELWAAYIAPATYKAIPADDVAAYAVVGWCIAADENRFVTALDRLQYYFRHPKIEVSNDVIRTHAMCLKAASLLFSGKEVDASELYMDLMENGKRGRMRLVANMALMWLHPYILRRTPDSPASYELTELVTAICRQQRVPKRFYAALPTPAAYGDLCTLFDQFAPAEDRERVRRLAEEEPWRVENESDTGERTYT